MLGLSGPSLRVEPFRREFSHCCCQNVRQLTLHLAAESLVALLFKRAYIASLFGQNFRHLLPVYFAPSEVDRISALYLSLFAQNVPVPGCDCAPDVDDVHHTRVMH